MGGVLETYERLIGHMLAQLPTPSPPSGGEKPSSVTAGPGTPREEDVRSKLSFILGKVQELKKHRYEEQMKVLHGLQNLRHIKVRTTLSGLRGTRPLQGASQEVSGLDQDYVVFTLI